MKKRKTSYYSEELKQQVIQEVLQGRLTKEAARRKYKILGKSAVLMWLRHYAPYSSYSINLKRQNKRQPIEQPMEDNSKLSKDELIEKIKHLEKQATTSRLKTALYEKMLEIVERDYHIKIKKK